MKLITGIKTQSYAESIQHGADTRCTLAFGYIVGIVLGEVMGPIYRLIGGEVCAIYYIGMLLLPFIAAYGAIYIEFYGRGKAVNRKIRYVLPGMANAGGSPRYWLQIPAYKDEKDGEIKPVTYSREWMLTMPLRFLTGLVALLPELLILFAIGLAYEVGVNNPALSLRQPENIGDFFGGYIFNDFFPAIGKLFVEMWKGLPAYLESFVTITNLFMLVGLTIAFTLGSWVSRKFYKKNPLKESEGLGYVVMLVALLLLFFVYTRHVMNGKYTLYGIFNSIFH